MTRGRFQMTRGRFYCHITNTQKNSTCWKILVDLTVVTWGRFWCHIFTCKSSLKNSWKSHWKIYRVFRNSSSFHYFHGFLPISIHQNSLKNLNSPTSPIFFVPKLPSGNTRGRFYCALFWQKNTEQSVWKSFRWWFRFPTFVCFQSVAPVSQLLISLKNLNSPTSPIFFVPKLPSVPTVVSGEFQLRSFRAVVPPDLRSEPTNPDDGANGFGVRIEITVATIAGTVGKNGSN